MSRLLAPGWRSALIALLAFLLLPAMPSALRSVVPITETWVLFLAALAVCAAVGWWSGGGVWVLVLAAAAAWLAATAELGMGVGSYGGSYVWLVRGWMLLLAASFGLASLLTPGDRFLVRGLWAVGIASVIAFVVAVATPDGVSSVRSVMRTEFGRRTEATIASMNEAETSPVWKWAAEKNPALDSTMAANEADLRVISDRASRTVPAFVALESLMALALAWAVYHRIAPTELGPRLASVRDFRFNDQLVWGLAVGATIYFLPVFADGKDAGLNLLLFFGALYLLRGVGVLSFMTRSRWMATLLIVMTILVPVVLGALALAVGVGDTWIDWRTRARAT